jgi:DNA-binding NtrC family response regulator
VFHGLVGVSAAIKHAIGQIRDVAPYDSTALVVGESGTGKELAARAIHAESARASKPFVSVSCGAYSEGLLESELFGHVRGASPGAERDRAGRFEMAEGGTVFLDEVAEASPKVQVRLLRLLQDREVERVGESRARPVDVRLVAATTKDLHREVREGRFREDLFYRLNVFTIRMPPLRERKEDVPVLVDFLVHKAALRTGKDVVAVSEEALERLAAHSWPGNVRELENVVESAVVRARGSTIGAGDLPPDFAAAEGAAAPVERMRDALRRAAGSVTLAARLLGVHRTTLWRWMGQAGLRRDDFLPA